MRNETFILRKAPGWLASKAGCKLAKSLYNKIFQQARWYYILHVHVRQIPATCWRRQFQTSSHSGRFIPTSRYPTPYTWNRLPGLRSAICEQSCRDPIIEPPLPMVPGMYATRVLLYAFLYIRHLFSASTWRRLTISNKSILPPWDYDLRYLKLPTVLLAITIVMKW